MILLKKTVLFTFVSILAALTLSFSVSAAEITKVIVSDFDNSVITVSGTESAAEKVSITMLPEGTTLSEGTYSAESNISVQSAEVAEGNFEVSFKFGGASMKYDLYVSGSSAPYKFEFISKEAVLGFVSELGEKKYSAGELPDKLTYFAPAMGIDLAFAETESDMAYLSEALIAESEDIKDNGLTAVLKIAARIKAELEFMDKLSKVQTASGVNTYLNAYSESAGFDISAYNALEENEQQYVCDELTGKSYTDIDDFKAALSGLISEAPEKADDNNGGESSGQQTSGSGGNGGSGGSGGGGGTYAFRSEAEAEQNNEDGRRLFDIFEDVDSVSWAWDAILYLSDSGVMNGVGDKNFAPDNKITREQFAKILSLAFDIEKSSSAHGFHDVADDGWSAGYIAAVKEAGLMQGIDENNFGYGMNISRQDICVTIARAVEKLGYHLEKTKTDFLDFDSISDYAKDAVSRLAGEGIISGTDEGKFNPEAGATRAEAAKIIYSVMKNILKK